MDATAYAAFIGGGSSITPFGVSSTNTFFAVNTNAITILSNQLTYSYFTISGAGAVTAGIDGTYYYKASGVYTNGATKGAMFTSDGRQGAAGRGQSLHGFPR